MQILTGKLWAYISRRFIFNLLLVLIVVCGIIYSVECIENLRRASNSDAPVSIVLLLSGLRLPWLIEQVMPFALLISAMMTFLTLGRSHELTIARSTGMSAWQFIAPVLAIAVMAGLVSTTILNPVATGLLVHHGEIENSAFRGKEVGVGENRWLRQGGGADGGSSVMYARVSRDLGKRLSGVTAFVYDGQGGFKERIEAKSAELHDGIWELKGVWTYVPAEKPVFSQSGYLPTNLNPEQITQSLANPEFVSFWALSRQIEISEHSGLDPNAFRLQYQALLARPLLYAAMALIAASVSLRLFRFGNVGGMILGGVAAGFLLYVGAKVTGDMGAAGVIGAAAAAWSPPLVAFFMSATVLLHQEDG